PQPARAHLGGAVRPRLGDGVALGVLLQDVVADRACGPEALFDVAGLEEVVVASGVIAPDPGKAVGLELEADGERVGALLVQAWPRGGDLVRDAEEVLDV